MKTYQQNENQYYTGCRAKLTRDGDNRRIAGLFRTWKIFRDRCLFSKSCMVLTGILRIFSAGISTFYGRIRLFLLWLLLPKRERFTTSKKENSNIFFCITTLHCILLKIPIFVQQKKKFVK